jgi:hypothetical protein
MGDDGTRKHPAVREWFPRHPEFAPHFPPTSGWWWNQVGRFFAPITTRRVRRGWCRGVGELEAAITDPPHTHNQRPTRFVWTEPAGLILGKVQKLAERLARPPKIQQRTSDSEHSLPRRGEIPTPEPC